LVDPDLIASAGSSHGLIRAADPDDSEVAGGEVLRLRGQKRGDQANYWKNELFHGIFLFLLVVSKILAFIFCKWPCSKFELPLDP
jgi:hypothetical protein